MDWFLFFLIMDVFFSVGTESLQNLTRSAKYTLEEALHTKSTIPSKTREVREVGGLEISEKMDSPPGN